MISFLLFISFIIHLITIICIILLFKQIKQKNKNEPNEIIEILDHYLEEIKLENEQLKNELHTQTARKTELKRPHGEPGQTETVERTTVPLTEIKNEDQMNASLESQVLHFYKQGKSADEIAKQLNCGKTEASLIIQLYGKNSVKA